MADDLPTMNVATAMATLKQVERVAEEWRAAVDSSSDSILVLDTRDIVLRVNRPATRFLGRSFLEIVGRPLAEVLPADLLVALPDRAEIAGSTSRIDRELRMPRTRRWLALACDPVTSTAGVRRGFVLSLRDITRRKRAEAATRRLLERQRELSAHVVSVREEERAAIAREIHDELGHTLTALKLDLAWLQPRQRLDLPEASERLRAMDKVLEQTIGAARRLITALRPGILDDFGLVAAIEWAATEQAHRAAFELRFAGMPDEPVLPPAVATSVFRIAQEALTNVARHAAAKRVEVAIARRGGSIELTVADDGQGFRPGSTRRKGSFGLEGMRERAASVGGELTLRSQPGHGTTVRLRVPWRPASRRRRR